MYFTFDVIFTNRVIQIDTFIFKHNAVFDDLEGGGLEPSTLAHVFNSILHVVGMMIGLPSPTTVRGCSRYLEQTFKAAKVEDARLSAQYIIAAALGKKTVDLHASGEPLIRNTVGLLSRNRL